MTLLGSRAQTFLVTDIEAVPDPSNPPPKPRRKVKGQPALPAPPHWQVACVGYLWLVYRPGSPLVASEQAPDPRWTLSAGVLWGEAEAEMLRQYVGFVDEIDPTIVTYAGRSFDLPVLSARSYRHGLPWRWYHELPDGRVYGSARHRFSEDRHLDLCEYLSDHGAGKRAGLAAWARAAGWPGKSDDVDGSKVEKMVADGQIEQVAAYCLTDVLMTAATLLRMLYVRDWFALPGGDATPEEVAAGALQTYRAAAGELCGLALGDERIAAWAKGLDVRSFLLLDSADGGDGGDDPYEREETKG